MFPPSLSMPCSMECLARLVWLIYGYVRVVLCVVHNLYTIPIYLLLTLAATPLYWISKHSYSVYENQLYYFCLYIVSGWSYGGGLVVHEHGDDIDALLGDPDVKLLVMANHQSMADVPLMMQSFSARSRWVLLWIMDSLFKWTNFGLVSQVHGDFFLNTKHYVTGDISKHCLTEWSALKNALVLFPEGGFRYKRIASSNAYALKRGYRFLNYVTYPRFSGYHELIKPELGVTHVVDLTICYDDPDETPGIVEIAMAKRTTEAHFHYRIYRVEDEPEIRTERWLVDRWTEKDNLLARHYLNMRRIKNADGLADSLKSSQAEHNGNQTHAKNKRKKVKKLIKMDELSSSDNSDGSDSGREGEPVAVPSPSAEDVEMNRAGELEKVCPNEGGGADEAQPGGLVGFDPRQGRPVRLSWLKLTCVHVFFVSWSVLVYSSIGVLYHHYQ